MNCCVNCFKDSEIIAIINGLNTIGNCDFCGSKNVKVFDISSGNNTLAELFDGLLDTYAPTNYLPSSFPKKNLSLLKNVLANQWNIFSLDEDDIYSLITNICAEKYKEHPELFDSPVGVLESIQNDYLEMYSIIKTYQWEDFVQEIKNKNRFHTNHINKDVLLLFFDYVKQPLKKGTRFFRGRICPNNSGFNISEMGAPPSQSAAAGRANPEGISYLYLADSEKTTLHEIRAGIFDYVTIGEFELQQDIYIINLANIDKISPFLGIDFTQHAINKNNLRKISNEIAKPLRRHDSFLDYLPTQYISDYIRNQGYAGIKYKSTMIQEGFNLAIFDESFFKCVGVKAYEINSIQYLYNIVK